MMTAEELDALVEEWRKRTAAGRPMPVTADMLNDLREGMAAHGEAEILRSERRSLAVDLGIARAERDAAALRAAQIEMDLKIAGNERDAALQRCAELEAKLAAIEEERGRIINPWAD